MSGTTLDDPTLRALVPERSRVCDAVLVVVALVVLILLWLSPTVLRPSLGSVARSNGPGGPGVLSITALDPRAVGGVVVQSVDDAPGATVVGAWIVAPDTRTGDVQDASLDRVRAVAQGPGVDPLPARLDDAAAGMQLAIAWRIDDCDALVEGFEPTVHLTTVLHTTARVTLPDMSGPAFDLANLRDAGVC